ncbi:MAG: hypothetical protein ACT4PW_05040 [Acidimicrobiia bacterium]
MLVSVSFGLVLVAAALLVAGFAAGGLTLIYVSIVLCVVAGVILLFGVKSGTVQAQSSAGGGASAPAPAPLAREPELVAVGGGSSSSSPAPSPPAEPAAPPPPSEPEPEPEAEPEAEASGQAEWLATDQEWEGTDSEASAEGAAFPIADYDELSSEEILPLVPQLYPDELDMVLARETAGKGRDDLVEALEARRLQVAQEGEPSAGAATQGPVPQAEPAAVAGASVPTGDGAEDDGPVFPISDYDELVPGEILPLVPQLYPDELDTVEARERAGQGRADVLEALAAARLQFDENGGSVDAPIEGYDAMSVHEVVLALPELDDAQLADVRQYEAANRARSGVLFAIARRLSGMGLEAEETDAAAPGPDEEPSTGPAPAQGGFRPADRLPPAMTPETRTEATQADQPGPPDAAAAQAPAPAEGGFRPADRLPPAMTPEMRAADTEEGAVPDSSGHVDQPAPAAAGDEVPPEGYEGRAADEVIGSLEGLDPASLWRARAQEASHDQRPEVLAAIDALLGPHYSRPAAPASVGSAPAPEAAAAAPDEASLPVADYDSLKVHDVVGLLDDLDRDQLAQVRAYESANRARSGVLFAIERRLARTAAGPSVEIPAAEPPVASASAEAPSTAADDGPPPPAPAGAGFRPADRLPPAMTPEERAGGAGGVPAGVSAEPEEAPAEAAPAEAAPVGAGFRPADRLPPAMTPEERAGGAEGGSSAAGAAPSASPVAPAAEARDADADAEFSFRPAERMPPAMTPEMRDGGATVAAPAPGGAGDADGNREVRPVAEILDALAGLTTAQLWQVRALEAGRKARAEVLGAIDNLLGPRYSTAPGQSAEVVAAPTEPPPPMWAGFKPAPILPPSMTPEMRAGSASLGETGPNVAMSRPESSGGAPQPASPASPPAAGWGSPSEPAPEGAGVSEPEVEEAAVPQSVPFQGARIAARPADLLPPARTPEARSGSPAPAPSAAADSGAQSEGGSVSGTAVQNIAQIGARPAGLLPPAMTPETAAGEAPVGSVPAGTDGAAAASPQAPRPSGIPPRPAGLLPPAMTPEDRAGPAPAATAAAAPAPTGAPAAATIAPRPATLLPPAKTPEDR